MTAAPLRPAAVVHLNVMGFPQAVAVAADRTLADRAFVVAAAAERATVLDVSPRARQEGLLPGMSLAAAEKRVRNLTVVAPDPAAWQRACDGMARIAGRYAPVVENAGGGHLYLDLAGTGRLFGPPEDCAARIRNEVSEALALNPAAAVAANKLTAKVLTRTLRPAGFASLRAGSEAAFLAGQDLRLLPGIGPGLLRLLEAAGVRSIGDLADLSDGESRALLGRRASVLRDAARGLDLDPVSPLALAERTLRRSLDFRADTTDAAVVRGALMTLVEDAGMELRFSRLAAGRLELAVLYADGPRSVAALVLPHPAVLDCDLFAAAERCFRRAAARRVRLRSLALALSGLSPDRRERDLFTPEAGDPRERLQHTVDAARRRYGPAALLRGTALLAGGRHV